MKVRIAEEVTQPSTVLGDWYATGVVIRRRQFVLCVSERSRLSVVLDAAPYATLPDRLASSLGDILRSIGISEERIQEEVSGMEQYRLAKATNRSVISTMNQYQLSLPYTQDLDPLSQSLFLADTITFSIPEHIPQEAARKLFGQPPRARLRVVR